MRHPASSVLGTRMLSERFGYDGAKGTLAIGQVARLGFFSLSLVSATLRVLLAFPLQNHGKYPCMYVLSLFAPVCTGRPLFFVWIVLKLANCSHSKRLARTHASTEHCEERMHLSGYITTAHA